MSTASTTPEKSKVVAEVERLGFGYTEVAQYDLEQLPASDSRKKIQVREDVHYVPREAVERYAQQMHYSQFPPIVVTSDNYLVDGNTRVAATRKNKMKFFPAIVLDVEWDDSTGKEKGMVHALAATLNSAAGTPLTKRERNAQAEKFVNLGWKNDEIVRALGLKPSSISGVRREIDATEKLQRVGLETNGALKGASLRALGSRNALALNSGPFKELALLAADAGLNMGEINAISKEVKTLDSDELQSKRLAELRTEMGDRIVEKRLTGKSKPPRSRQLRQHLGFVTAYAGREQELLETDPKVSKQHYDTIAKAVKVLSAVLEMQRTP